jgi:hypothetical protein
MSSDGKVYAEVIERIREAGDPATKTKGFGVFHGTRVSNGEEVFLIAIVENLDKNGKPSEDTEMAIVGEFLPNKPTKELYNLKDFWIVEEEAPTPEAPPLPKNVFQFRKKK